MEIGTCKVCGGAVPYVAATCPHCGTTHKTHAVGLAVALGVLALLVVGAGFGLGLYLSHRMELGTPADGTADVGAPSAATQPGSPTVTSRSSDDFSWLSTGMNSCDSEAANDLPKIYFLVVPLVATNPNDTTWSAKAFDKAGTNILLSSDDALAGLRSGTLRLNDGPYTFSVLDPTTNAVYTWKSKVGASKLASTDAAAINTFKIRAFRGEEPGSADWSSDFNRHQGSCHWVNVLIAP